MITTTVKSGKVKGATGRMQRECPLCGCAELDYEFIVENCPLCCCRECSLTFLNPQPDASETGHAASSRLATMSTKSTRANAETRLDQFISYAGTSSRQTAAGGRRRSRSRMRRSGAASRLCRLSPAELDNYALEGRRWLVCRMHSELRPGTDQRSARQRWPLSGRCCHRADASW